MENIAGEQIKNYSDAELHAATAGLALSERKLSTLIIHHLREIDRRHLWRIMSYSSLFEYCIQELRYSESQAYRRISALKLINEIPEIENKIIEGTMNLTTVTQAQSFFKHEAKEKKKKLSTEEKISVLEMIDGKTQKEVALELASISPSFSTPDRAKPISADEFEIRFKASRELMSNIDRLREILASALGLNASFDQIFGYACQQTLNRIDPMRRPAKKSPNSRRDAYSKCETADSREAGTREPRSTDFPEVSEVSEVSSATISASAVDAAAETSSETSSEVPKREPPKTNSVDANGDSSAAKSGMRSQPTVTRKLIPAVIRREVWRRDGNQCTYRETPDGRRCECRSGLEIDHIIPVAHGGSNEIHNLRLYCRAHNQLAAIQIFGEENVGPRSRLAREA